MKLGGDSRIAKLKSGVGTSGLRQLFDFGLHQYPVLACDLQVEVEQLQDAPLDLGVEVRVLQVATVVGPVLDQDVPDAHDELLVLLRRQQDAQFVEGFLHQVGIAEHQLRLVLQQAVRGRFVEGDSTLAEAVIALVIGAQVVAGDDHVLDGGDVHSRADDLLLRGNVQGAFKPLLIVLAPASREDSECFLDVADDVAFTQLYLACQVSIRAAAGPVLLACPLRYSGHRLGRDPLLALVVAFSHDISYTAVLLDSLIWL